MTYPISPRDIIDNISLYIIDKYITIYFVGYIVISFSNKNITYYIVIVKFIVKIIAIYL